MIMVVAVARGFGLHPIEIGRMFLVMKHKAFTQTELIFLIYCTVG